MSEAVPHPNRRSALALMQAGLVACAAAWLLCALVLAWWGHERWALAVVLVVLGGHAVALAFEFALAAWVQRRGDAPAIAPRIWCRAWWREIGLAPKVFAWRQPFLWRNWPDDVQAVPGNAATTVLVHGFVCNRGFWLPWLRALRERGLAYTTVNLEPVFGGIEAYVPLIEEAVARAERLGGGRPTLVCHSMGGLAARAWLVSGGGQWARVKRVITIGSPHHGAWIGRFSRVANGRQMRENCDWLCELAAQEAAQRGAAAYADFVCWYTDTDNIVFPSSTARLPGADNRLVPGAAHVELGFHPRVMAESLSMLASAASSPKARTDS
jgi:triacylglycerol lipase